MPTYTTESDTVTTSHTGKLQPAIYTNANNVVAHWARVTVSNSAAITYTLDGTTTPTATVGNVLTSTAGNTSTVDLLSQNQIANFWYYVTTGGQLTASYEIAPVYQLTLS